MPQIPRYNSQVSASVEPTVRMNENAPIEMFGGGQAMREASNAAQGLLKESRDLFQEEKKKADDAWSMDFYSQAVNKKNDLLYNEKSGALGKKGQDALASNEVYGGQYEKYLDELENSAANGDQRLQAKEIRRRMSAEFGSTLQRHAFQESEQLKTTYAKAAIDAAGEDVVLNIQNPGKLNEGIALQESIAYQTLADQGVTGELADYQVKQIKSKTFTRGLDRLVTMGDTKSANSLFERLKVEGQLTADDQEAFEKTIHVANLKNESLAASEEIVSKFGNLSAAQKAVREKYPDNAELQDETMRRVKQRFSDQEAAREFQDRTNYRSAMSILEQSKGQSEIPVQLEAALRGSGKLDDLRKYREDLRAGIRPPIQSSRYFEIQRMMVNQPEKFVKLDFEQEKPHIAPSEISQFLTQQAAIKAGKGDESVRGVRTINQLINQRLTSLGKDPTPKAGSEDAKFVDSFWAQVEDEITEFRQRTGKSPSVEDKANIVDKLSLKIPGSGGWFGGDKTVAEIGFEDIPEDDRTQILLHLRKSKRPVTERAMVDIYRRLQIKGLK